jgi:hypothetical protein
MDGEASKADKMSSTRPNSNLSVVLDYICQGKDMRKTHFYILSLTKCDTETLILLSAQIYKFQYLSFRSSNFKSRDRSRNLTINRIHGEILIFRFWVLHLWKSRWLFIFPEGQIQHHNPKVIFETWVFIFSFFLRILPFYLKSRSMWNLGCLMYKTSHSA